MQRPSSILRSALRSAMAFIASMALLDETAGRFHVAVACLAVLAATEIWALVCTLRATRSALNGMRDRGWPSLVIDFERRETEKAPSDKNGTSTAKG